MASLLASGTWSDTDTWNDSAIWVDSASGTGPILGTVSVLEARTITPLRTDASPQTWAAPFNPADNSPYVIDLSTFLAGESLDTLTIVSLDPVAAALGVLIDIGEKRPTVDRINKRIAIWPKVDPSFQGPSYFVSSVPARLILTFTTLATTGVPAETYRRSGVLTIAQVI